MHGEAFVDGTYKPNKGAAWRTNIVKNYVERVMSVSDTGEVVINMQEVEKILSKDADAITSQEYGALALAYLNADDEELGQFLQYMMGERTDVDPGMLEVLLRGNSEFVNHDYTEWKLDQEKSLEIQYRIAMTSEVALYMMQVSDEELADDMEKQRATMLQRLSLMNAISGQRTFRGELGAEYPDIAVMQSENGDLIVGFCEERVEPLGVSNRINYRGKSQIVIGSTLFGSYIDNVAIDNAEYSCSQYFEYNSLVEDMLGFAGEEWKGEITNDAENALLDYAERRFPVKTMRREMISTVAEMIPFVGDCVGFVVDVAQ